MSDTPTFTLISDLELEARPEPPQLINGLLQQRSLAALVGFTQSGKSLLALDWAMSIQTGQPWQGHQITKGNVVYVIAEGDAGFKRRILAWKAQHGISSDDPTGIQFMTDAPQLGRQSHIGAILSAISRNSGVFPDLIVIDTFARCMVGAEENSARDMSRLVAACGTLQSETGAAILVVHHSGWNKTRERGSTALRSAVDTHLLLQRRSGDHIVLSCEKQRNQVPHPPIHMAITNIELPDMGSAPLLTLATGPTKANMPETRQKALGALVSGTNGHGLSFSKWCEVSGLSKSTFKRAVTDLKDMHLVVEQDGEYISTDAQ